LAFSFEKLSGLSAFCLKTTEYPHLRPM